MKRRTERLNKEKFVRDRGEGGGGEVDEDSQALLDSLQDVTANSKMSSSGTNSQVGVRTLACLFLCSEIILLYIAMFLFEYML